MAGRKTIDAACQLVERVKGVSSRGCQRDDVAYRKTSVTTIRYLQGAEKHHTAHRKHLNALQPHRSDELDEVQVECSLAVDECGLANLLPCVARLGIRMQIRERPNSNPDPFDFSALFKVGHRNDALKSSSSSNRESGKDEREKTQQEQHTRADEDIFNICGRE